MVRPEDSAAPPPTSVDVLAGLRAFELRAPVDLVHLDDRRRQRERHGNRPLRPDGPELGDHRSPPPPCRGPRSAIALVLDHSGSACRRTPGDATRQGAEASRGRATSSSRRCSPGDGLGTRPVRRHGTEADGRDRRRAPRHRRRAAAALAHINGSAARSGGRDVDRRRGRRGAGHLDDGQAAAYAALRRTGDGGAHRRRREPGADDRRRQLEPVRPIRSQSGSGCPTTSALPRSRL